MTNLTRELERKTPGKVASAAGLALVGVVFVLMASVTWRKWPDLIIDFGAQLYIPWRLSEGAVLYRDLFYFAGSPLSQYFNALLFKVFGVSFSTLIAANLTFAGVMVWFIYHRFLAVSDVLTATMICLGIVVVFSFSEYVPFGNYNFIAPYSHEILHGIILSLVAVGLLSDWLARPRWRVAVLAGFCAGLVFLTKPDIFLSLAAVGIATLALHWLNRRETGLALKSLAGFGLAMLTPLLFFFLFFLRVEDYRMSLRSVVFGWLPLFEPAVRNNPFYVKFRGMDDPLGHLQEMATHFLCAALVIGLYAIILRSLNRWKSSVVKWGAWLILMLPLLFWAFRFNWTSCGSSLPLWCLTILIILGWRLKTTPGARKFTFPFLWSVFALVLMSKMGLFARIWHCGFALVMPAFVITVYFLLWLLPGLQERRFQVPAKYLRATFVLTLLAGFMLLFNRSQEWYHLKGETVGRDGDKIVTFGPSVDVSEGIKVALDWVDKNVPPDGTLAVLPSGVMLNYLSGRINPTPCLFWDPNSMAVFGQATMTARFKAAPPDYVLVLEQDQSEFGVKYLGGTPGYGVELMQWIKQNYKAAVIIGNEPLRDGHFGVEIFKRLPPATPGMNEDVRQNQPL